MSKVKIVDVCEVFGDELGINIFQLLKLVELLLTTRFPTKHKERREYVRKVIKDLLESN